MSTEPDPIRPQPGTSPPHLVAALALVSAVLAAYLPALANGFVWDDTALVFRDPLVRSWRLAGEAFRHFLFLDATGSSFYRPIQRLTYLWDYAWFGFEPGGWHGTSIAAHAGAVLAFHGFARAFLRSHGIAAWAAFGAALVWAIHPVHTSAVIYVSGRADPLAALFGFTALWLGLHGGGTGPGRITAVAALLLCAGLSKESGLLFGPLWLALLAFNRVPARRLAWALALVIIVLACYGWMRSAAIQTPPPPASVTPLPARLQLSFESVAEYAGILLLPLRLTMERDLRVASGGALRIAVSTVLVLVGLWFLFARHPKRSRPGTTAALLALVSFLPVSGLIPLNANFAEHWLYVPSAWLLLAVAAVGAGFDWNRAPAARLACGAVLGVWLCFLGVRTWTRNADWRDAMTFALRTINTADSTARMRMNIASMEYAAGRREFALRLQQSVLDAHPELSQGRLSLAAMLTGLKRYDEAERELDRIADIAWLRPEQLELRSAIALARGDPAGSEVLLREAAELAPRSWNLRRRLARLVTASGRPAQAAEELAGWMAGVGGEFRSESWLLLAGIAAKADRGEVAARALRQARRLDARFGETAPAAGP